MEGGGGGGGGGGRRISLLDHMSVVDHGRETAAGLTLEAVLGGAEKRASATAMVQTSAQMNRTLLDVIRDEEPHGSLFGHKDKKSWKAFRDRLRLKRAGAAWTSSIHVPASDLPIQNHNNNVSVGSGFGNNNSRSFMSRRNSVRFTTDSSLSHGSSAQPDDSGDNASVSLSSARPQMTRRSSTRFGPTAVIPSDSTEADDSDGNIHALGDGPPARSFRPQMVRHSSTRYQIPNPESEDNEEEPARETRRHLATVLAEERAMSAREAVVAQEAAEAEAAAQAAAAAEVESDEEAAPENEDATEGQAVRMSLMDLLEETDRQMGLEGSRYTMADNLQRYEDEEEEEGAEDGGGGGGVEHTCCVCMVRHKGAAFIPCGHTFCRLCSRELWVQRGNCPLCNGFILEILDIF